AYAFDINDGGEVAGASGACWNTSIPPAVQGLHAVLWEKDGTPVDLGNLGGNSNVASTINNRGEVGGGALVPADGTIHAFVWTRQTGMQDYGSLPGAIATVVPCCHTINNSGQTVGFAIDATTFALTA